MRQVEYKGYTFFEDGTFINKRGKQGKIHTKDNRCSIKMSINNKRQTVMYHRLRYYLFSEKFDYDDKDICVIAKDGNYLNLNLDNYSLMRREDLHMINRGIKKLSKETVKQIREEYKGTNNPKDYYAPDYKSYNFLAIKYGISKSTVKQIIKGEIHKEDI